MVQATVRGDQEGVYRGGLQRGSRGVGRMKNKQHFTVNNQMVQATVRGGQEGVYRGGLEGFYRGGLERVYRGGLEGWAG
eukprot:313430-Prorocentrum_minimum.AAC.1